MVGIVQGLKFCLHEAHWLFFLRSLIYKNHRLFLWTEVDHKNVKFLKLLPIRYLLLYGVVDECKDGRHLTYMLAICYVELKERQGT